MTSAELPPPPRLAALGRLVPDPSAFRAAPPDRPLLTRGAGPFTDLLDLAEIDDLLVERSLRRNDYRLVRDDAVLPDLDYVTSTLIHDQVPDGRKVATQLAAGATLILQGLNEYSKPLADFCRRLGHDLGRPVHANAYLTPPGAQGFAAHHDVRDAFIIQVSGRKHWTLRRPLLAEPVSAETWDTVAGRADPAEPPGEPWSEPTLEPGDCLWLPRGWIHSARSAEEASLHLTLSLHSWTKHWALGQLLSTLGVQPGTRAALDPDFLRDDEAARAEAASWRAALVGWLDRTDDAALAAAVRAAGLRTFAAPRRRPASAVLGGLDVAGAEFAVNAHAVHATSIAAGRLTLHLGDRALSMPQSLDTAVADLLARDLVTVDGLDRPASRTARIELLRTLYREGVIEPRDQSSLS